MDLYTPPGWGKKSGSPKPPNSFQKELDAKMKERKRLGLSANITPSASEQGSDDELASDDDLMAQFNMTNKSKKKSWNPPNQRTSPGFDRQSPASNRSKSPYDSLRRSPASDLIFGRKTPATEEEEDEEDSLDGPSSLMMTMKKPWNPSSVGSRDASKTLPNPKTRKSKAFDMFNEETSRDHDKKERTWTPPTFKKDNESEKENKPLRPKSPNVRGRKTPNLELDSIREEDKPVPSPRILKEKGDSRPKPKPRGRFSPKGYHDSEDEDDEMKLLSARRESPLDFGKHRDGDRRTPSDGRRTPKVNIFGRDSPGEGRRTSVDGRHTPKDGRHMSKDGRKTPDGKRTPNEDRRTPKGGKRLTFDDKKGRRDDRESPEVKKKSVLDMYSSNSAKQAPRGREAEKKKSKSYLRESSSEDEGMGAPRRSPSPVMRGRKTPERDRYLGGPSLRNKHGRDTPEDDVDGFRMGPSLGNKNRRSPLDEGPSLRSKSPYNARESRSPYGDGLKPKLRRNRAIDEDDDDEDVTSAFRPTPTRRNQRPMDDQESRGRSRSRGNKDERESSLCRDVEKDPTMKKQQEKVKEKKLAKAHTSQGRDLENAIVSVENAQDKTMRFIQPDKAEKEDEDKTKSLLTPKTPKHRPKPRYNLPSSTSPTSPQDFNFNSTSDIKQAVYQQWYAERQEKAKLALKEKKVQEKELALKKKKQEEDKLIEAKASYQAWMEKKKDFDQEHREKKRTEEENKMKKLQEEEDKKKDAVVTYRLWKENKDGSLREQQRKKQREQRDKEDEERNVKNTKQKDSQTAFKKWKENKDNHIKKQTIRNKQTQRTKREEELDAQYQRERGASESYEKWMARKEKQEMNEMKRLHRKQLEEEENPRPSWSPASRTIPFGR